MKTRSFQFRPMTMFLAVFAAIICYYMSYWQYTRYVGKKEYFAVLEARAAMGPAEPAAATSDWEPLHYRTVRVTGQFDYAHEMVLINRSKDNVAGVKLITPLRMEDGRNILVDRGFIPYNLYADGDRKQVQPEGLQTVEGLLTPSQEKSFFLAPAESLPADGSFKERFLRVDIAVMAEQLDYPLLPVYVDQNNQTESLPAHTPRAVVGPGRHMNYTIQWASFGSFSLFYGLFLQFRPRRKSA